MNQTNLPENFSEITKYHNEAEITYFYNRSDHPDILRSLSPRRYFILQAIPIMHYIGIANNILALIVLIQPQMITKKGIFYLTFLAFSDFMYNFLSQLPLTLQDLKIVSYDIFKLSNTTCFFYDLRVTTFHFYSVILMLFGTLDRFLHIYRPLSLNRNFNSLRSKTLMGILLFFVSLVFALPHGFLMVYSEREKDCDAHAFFKQKFLNTSFSNYQIYFTFTEPILIWFIPGLMILFMNGYVILKIIKSNKMDKKHVGTTRTKCKF